MIKLIKYLLIGIFIGIALTKAEVISWFRIYEMFMFQSLHMYLIIGSAVATGMLSVFMMKKFNIKTIKGKDIKYPEKKFEWNFIYGGTIFGLGWAMTGACPGPFYALIGNGATIYIIALIAAVVGTYTYGVLKNKIPH